MIYTIFCIVVGILVAVGVAYRQGRHDERFFHACPEPTQQNMINQMLDGLTLNEMSEIIFRDDKDRMWRVWSKRVELPSNV